MRRLLVIAGMSALATAGMLTAARADADPLSYLQSLNSHGLSVYDTAQAIDSGYTICSMLDYANGQVVAEYVYTHTSYGDVPDMDTAGTWVMVAVEELCPYHDHRAGYVV